jgi:uncharacterized protein (DUF488 family)
LRFCREVIATVGHSNRPFAAFLEILQAHRIDAIADVRRFPSSRRWPHFSATAISALLGEAGIAYSGLPELGGRRTPLPDSPHRAWREASFRGYADFMDTPEFREGLSRFLTFSDGRRAALMCAEALPWRCHRSLIADTLVARGSEVTDLLSPADARTHRLPAFARVEGARVVYDGGELPLG